jgi:hypothetical protein
LSAISGSFFLPFALWCSHRFLKQHTTKQSVDV